MIPASALLHPPVATSWRFQLSLGVLFFLLLCFLHTPVFFRSVVNWDESLYFLIAEQWRAGHLPYTASWDNKPVGVYAIFYLFQILFGDFIVSIRIASVCFLAISAWAVSNLCLLIPGRPDRWARGCAVFAGVAFVVCSISNDGLAANTEIFMATFTLLAVLAALTPRFMEQRPFVRGAVVGLLLGAAFMTKYVAVFEAPAVAFALFLARPMPAGQWPRAAVGAFLGGLAPIVWVVLTFALASELQTWLQASIYSNLLRLTGGEAVSGAAVALKILKWLPVCAAGLFVVVVGSPRPAAQADPAIRRFRLFLLFWILGGAAGVCAARSFYSHYFLQILPSLCVALGWVAIVWGRRVSALPWPALTALGALILLLPGASAAAALINSVKPLLNAAGRGSGLGPDVTTVMTRDIVAAHPGAALSLYVFDYEPVLYSLAHATPPTRYAYPAFLTTCSLARVAGVDAPREVARILATNPEFIVKAVDDIAKLPVNRASYAQFEHAVADRYDRWRDYPDAVVYRLRPGAGAAPVKRFETADACPKPRA